MKKPIEHLASFIAGCSHPDTIEFNRPKVEKYMKRHKIGAEDLTIYANRINDYSLILNLINFGLCTSQQMINDCKLHSLAKHPSIYEQRYDEIKKLLKAGANPLKFFNNYDVQTPLYLATSNCDKRAVKLMLDKIAQDISLNMINSRCLDCAATMAEENDRMDILMLYLEQGIIPPANFCNTKTNALYSPNYDTVGKVLEIYKTPENFLNLSKSSILSDSLPYYKQAAMYGFQRIANKLKKKKELTPLYLENCKKTINEINSMVEKIQEEVKKERERHSKALEESRLKNEKIKTEQEKLFEGVVDITKILAPTTTSNIEQIGKQLADNKNVAKAINDAQQIQNTKDYSKIDKIK